MAATTEQKIASQSLAVAEQPPSQPSPAAKPSPGVVMKFEPQDMRQLWWLCEQLVGTGFLPRTVQQPGQAVAIILAGKELGLGVMQSLRGVHIIEGKISLAADTQLALMIRASIRFKWLEKSDRRAALRLERDGQESEDFAFTMEEAERAKLVKTNRDGSPGNWQKYPAAMLRARVISIAGRAYAPDVLAGVYTLEELNDGDQSEVVDVEAARTLEQSPKAPRAPATPPPEPERPALPPARPREPTPAPATEKAQVQVREQLERQGANHQAPAEPVTAPQREPGSDDVTPEEKAEAAALESIDAARDLAELKKAYDGALSKKDLVGAEGFARVVARKDSRKGELSGKGVK